MCGLCSKLGLVFIYQKCVRKLRKCNCGRKLWFELPPSRLRSRSRAGRQAFFIPRASPDDDDEIQLSFRITRDVFSRLWPAGN